MCVLMALDASDFRFKGQLNCVCRRLKTKDGVIVDPDIFDLYEVIPERSVPLSPAKPSQREAPSLTAGKKGDAFTVRDMLAGVKDVRGHSHFQSAFDDDALDLSKTARQNTQAGRLSWFPLTGSCDSWLSTS